MVVQNGLFVSRTSSKKANVFTYTDYYPFGSIARSGGITYRYEYQGAYADKDPITGFNNFDLRMYDGRIGRWLSTDPNAQYYSPYVGMGNDPVGRVDPDGGMDGGGGGPETGPKDKIPVTVLPNGDINGGVMNEVVFTEKVQHYYFDNYFKYYQSHPEPNPYSPYLPDGYGVTFAGSADINYTTYSASLSLVLDANTHKVGGFSNINTGLSTNRFSPPSLSVSVDVHNTYGGSNLFEGLKGFSIGGSGSLFNYGMAHSQSAMLNPSNQFIINNTSGVQTNSFIFNFKPSVGANVTSSYTKRWF